MTPDAWWQQVTGCSYCSLLGVIPFIVVIYLAVGFWRLRKRWHQAVRNDQKHRWTEADTFIECLLWPLCFDDEFMAQEVKK